MKVIIKNKFFSLGGSSGVKDENDKDVFIVKGRVFSINKVKWICDLDGNKLYRVRNKWFNIINQKAFVFDGNKNKLAVVKHPFLSPKKFVLEGFEDEITIDGDFFSLLSSITKNGEVVGTIRRNITIVNDAFTLEANEKDMPFMIALVIAIDNICDKIRN